MLQIRKSHIKSTHTYTETFTKPAKLCVEQSGDW